MQQQQTIERKIGRTSTKFTAVVTCAADKSSGVVKDLSDAGLCIQLTFDIQALPNRHIEIDSAEFGHLTGVVQWARGNLIGIRLNVSSNSDAKIRSYYKYFQ